MAREGKPPSGGTETSRSNYGWTRAATNDGQPGKRTGRLLAETELGPISISANVKFNGPRAGLRRIYTQNPTGTWTGVAIGAQGNLMAYALAATKDEAREQLERQQDVAADARDAA